ncbi:hypothetical protein [Serratia fonticola]|uniref:Uncharacterized protein n=1 Tax=Serratia fonticola TaxID=47917 RepID=A0ABY9PT93_SERFO|nr:hypothetical protein [Serratia fonticola]WMT16657.1 hypothetical protein RFB13_10180 [Serratia fonticola]
MIACVGNNLHVEGFSIPEEIEPPESQFSMKSAVWELNTADVSDLPILSVSGNGFSATIKDIANNNLCLNYVTAGVKNKTYALSATNTSNVHGGRNLFTLQDANSQLFYNLQLASNTGVKANDYSFPAASVKTICNPHLNRKAAKVFCCFPATQIMQSINNYLM